MTRQKPKLLLELRTSISTTLRSQNQLYVLALWWKWVLTWQKIIPIQSHNSSGPKVLKSCVISQEPFLYSVRTLSSLACVYCTVYSDPHILLFNAKTACSLDVPLSDCLTNSNVTRFFDSINLHISTLICPVCFEEESCVDEDETNLDPKCWWTNQTMMLKAEWFGWASSTEDLTSPHPSQCCFVPTTGWKWILQLFGIYLVSCL